MSSAGRRPSCEEVLDAFAIERGHGRTVLERYLQVYPEYAGELVDLSRELNRSVGDDTAPISAADQKLIDEAWTRYAAALPETASDPFAALSADEWRAVARQLNVPRQVVTALRERRVSLMSIPRWFFARFATAMHSSVAVLESLWEGGEMVGARSYKADNKPHAGEQVTFEQVLIEAGVAAEKRAKLLAEGE